MLNAKPGATRAPDAPRLCTVSGRDAWYVDDHRRRFSTGTADRAEAQRFLADYIKALTETREPTPATVAELLSLYLADREAHRKPGASRLADAHKPLRRLLGAQAAQALTPALCMRYADLRNGEGVGDATVRTEIEALRAAVRWHFGDKAPRLAMPPKPQPRDRWLTRAEADRLLAACDDRHLRLFVLLALHTAARSSSILALTWNCVDLERRRVDYREPGKPVTRKRRVPVPVNDTLAVALAAAQGRATCEFVIEWAGGQVASIKHGFAAAAKRAKLADVTPHTCRHTAATWMAQAGVPLWQVAGMLGHSDAALVANTYGHHHPDHLKEAAAALE